MSSQLRVGEKTASDRVLGEKSNLRHAFGQNQSLEWALEKFLKVVTLPFAAGTATEVDTGYDLPDNCIVLDVLIEVITADTGEVIDVGLLSSESGGDTDGFLDGVSVNATGLVAGNAVLTTGSNETYMSSCTLGALLATFLAGSDAVEDVGTFVKKMHLSDAVTAKSVVYDHNATTPTSTGYIHLLILEFP